MTERCEKTELLIGECAHCRAAGIALPATIPVKARPKEPKREVKQIRSVAMTASSDLAMRFIPKGLLEFYEQVVMEEFGSNNLGTGKAVDPNQLPGIGRRVGGLGSARSGRPDIRSVTRVGTANARRQVIRSERAMTERARIDRKLKRIVREMKNFLASLDDPNVEAVPTHRRCAGRCTKFGDPDWLYCARCGGPMQEVT